MFKKLKYRFLFWMIRTKAYEWIIMHVIPFIRLTTYYALPDNKKFQNWGPLERRGYKLLEPGDIILTIDSQKLTTKIIGNATKDIGGHKPYMVPTHTALCIGKGRDLDFEIAEMTHHNYTKSTWEDVTREATRIVIIRCTAWDEAYVNNTIIPMATSPCFQRKLYDGQFQLSVDRLACSELPYHADVEKRAKVDLSPVIGDQPYISPVGWMLAENVKIIWDSNLESI
jgi:hypothetical protein